MTLSQNSLSEVGASIGKPETYEALYNINRFLQAVIDNLDRLKAVEAVPPTFAEIGRLTAEQLRSEINLTATIRLQTSECEEAFLFEQQRLTLEASLKECPALPQEPEFVVSPAPCPDNDQQDEP